MKATGQGAPEQAQSVKPRSRSGLTLLVAFLLSAIITVVAGRVYFEDQRAAIIAQKSAELSSIRDLKTDEIARWRQDLFGDVRQAAAGPTLPNDVGAWLADPEDARPAAILREWLRGICQVQGYAGALILTPDGSRWVSTAKGRDPDARDRLEAQDAAESAEATVTDLFLDPVDGRPRVDAVAPLRGDATRTAAVLVFHHDPNTDLYPMVRGWPAPSGTSETLLIRRSGDGILYLNELRYRDATALKLSFPRSRADLPGVQALAGGPRVVEGVDYRGVPVLAAVGPVAGTTWYVVAKVDASEAYGGVSDRQRMTVAGVVLLILVLALAFSLAWRQRTAAAGRKEVVAEQAAGLMAEQYDYLTRYANDVVLLVDEDLRILQANDRATAVYGYTRGELLTMTLADLHDPAFHERARQEFDLAKREGSRVFEARHVRKDGSLTDMEVSARTIDSGDRTLYLAVERDITERKAAETRLRTLSLRHEAILGAIPEIIAEVDADGIYTWVNDAGLRFFGDDVVGHAASDYFLGDVETRADPGPLPDGSADTTYHESWQRRHDGERRLLAWWCRTLANGSGAALGALSTARDVTERVRAEEELAARTEALARSNEELERFAYIASHDLQEPLRMIASYVQLLQKRYQGRLDPDADEFIGYAVDGAKRMQTLINDLLAYSRVGSEGAPFAPADLETALCDVLASLSPAIAEAGAAVTHDPMPVVSCDATQIGQVFQNLIANGVKFNRAEKPAVHVSARRADGEWVFSVADNGIGVEPEYFDRIFVIFQRLQPRTSYPGTGLGLAISKRIIERHGGRVWVESRPEAGSTFYFTLPA